MEGDNSNNYSFSVVCFSITCGLKILNLPIEGNDSRRESSATHCWLSTRVLIYELADVALGSDKNVEIIGNTRFRIVYLKLYAFFLDLDNLNV